MKITIDQKLQDKIERSKKMFAKLTEMGVTAHLNEETGEITIKGSELVKNGK